MSENTAPRRGNDQQVVDSLLADAGLEGNSDLRTELLELRSLANTAPMPSDAVRALMAGGPATTVLQLAPAEEPADEPARGVHDAPIDELAARRRRKRRTAIAGLAVAVSLAGGATAAAASEGGLPGAFQHLGAAIGSVVSQLAPGTGNAPQPNVPGGSTPGQGPAQQESQPAVVPGQPAPTPAAPTAPAGTAQTDPHATPGGNQSQAPKGPAHTEPGKGVIPAAPSLPVTPPDIDPSKLDPSKLEPSNIPVPVPSQLIPTLPEGPKAPAK
ncbi:hypothetical protein [Paenarthrobacter nitroguajacolicus]|uniref:hypothetical protein n=1 Tax=Paenarthrobacter nitroguajacolicus TaxID=211146 RepID=UPI00248D128B|nr:hypothetical protein [Paenarthrobacter nitroguajacolicus]MDI2035478.1 hypothetical protein [Paenarthrobacter nitroguajacolicus]